MWQKEHNIVNSYNEDREAVNNLGDNFVEHTCEADHFKAKKGHFCW